MSTPLTAAQALLRLISANRRSGSTTVLLESPKVVSGEALFVAWSQRDLDHALELCPTLRGTTLQRLKDGHGDTRGPMVFDPAAVQAALEETAKDPRATGLRPYEIADYGESVEVDEVSGDGESVADYVPRPGSEKAFVVIRLPNGSFHWTEVPYTGPCVAQAPMGRESDPPPRAP